MVLFMGLLLLFEIVDDLKAQLDGYDFYAYSDSIDDSSKQLEKEMTVILGIALVIIIAVLLFTSQSFMEVPIFLIVFGGTFEYGYELSAR